MPDRKRRLFRDTALQHYFHRREKDILPQMVKPPVFLGAWFIIALLSLMIFLAWWQEVPIFADGSAVSLQFSRERQAMLVVLPADYLHKAHIGSACHIRFQSIEPYYPCKIIRIASTTTDPTMLQQRYQLDNTISSMYQDALVALEVEVSPEAVHITHMGELAQARIQVGSRRILSLLPENEEAGE